MDYFVVTGSRSWNWADPIHAALEQVAVEYPDAVMIEGGANGADRIARHFWQEIGRMAMTIPAQWDKYGRSAGPIRNRRMLATPGVGLCIGFVQPDSKGTWDCLAAAAKFGVRRIVVDHKGEVRDFG